MSRNEACCSISSCSSSVISSFLHRGCNDMHKVRSKKYLDNAVFVILLQCTTVEILSAAACWWETNELRISLSCLSCLEKHQLIIVRFLLLTRSVFLEDGFLRKMQWIQCVFTLQKWIEFVASTYNRQLGKEPYLNFIFRPFVTSSLLQNHIFSMLWKMPKTTLWQVKSNNFLITCHNSGCSAVSLQENKKKLAKKNPTPRWIMNSVSKSRA